MIIPLPLAQLLSLETPMLSIETALDLYKRNLDYAKRLTADLPAEKWSFQPAPKMNHPTWVIGHLARTSDLMGSLIVNENVKLPDSWMEHFGPTSTLAIDPSVYPNPTVLLEALEAGHKHTVDALHHADLRVLHQPPKLDRLKARFPTLGGFIAYGMFSHESLHLGQLSAWRRVQGLPSV